MDEREIKAQLLRYFFERTHRGHLGMRVSGASMFAVTCLLVVGTASGPWLIAWLAAIALAEFHILQRVKSFETELDRSDLHRLDQISAWSYAYASGLSAIYVAPAFGLSLFGLAGATFSVILAVAVMINALSQHVLTRSMIFFTIPAPFLALAVSAYHLAVGGFPDHTVIFVTLMFVFTLQVISLAMVTAGSYRSLFVARAEAVREARAREVADAANQAKTDFLANMSHELRTPLNAIIGYSEIIRENAVDDDRRADAEDVDRVLRASRHLLELINDVLDVAKAESGAIDMNLTAFDVGRVVADAVDTLRPAIQANNNRIIVSLDEGAGIVRSDPKRLSQCLLNLLSNAAKYTRDGVIEVSASRTDGIVSVAVRDSGIGIAADRLEAIFDPFVQASPDVTVKHGGAGLGLTISRRLARLLGGDVTVTSAPGQGSTFTLTISASLSAARKTPSARAA